ncbi:MAG TPA: anti-sigma factor antagonist [Planctomycetaceae bacterium]|nr:anti-sigma factor antagonist [Planctomycetaceae bacterium]
MKILDIRDVQDVVVVSFLHGKILDQTVIRQVGEEFKGLTTQSAADRRLLLNLSKVGFMASAMIGQIMALHKQCKKDKVDLKLCCISPNIMEVFQITTLDKILDIHDTEEKALAAFGPPRRSWTQRQ